MQEAQLEPRSHPACGVIFPGQGVQRAGMARDFHTHFAASRAVFDEASDTLGIDMAALCFEPDDRLAMTEFAQPAILTAEIAMLRAVQFITGLRPAFWAGHSLGEYAALVGAGALPFADAVSLVRERGRMMQATVPQGVGAMMAISASRLDPCIVAGCLVDLRVDIACLNAPEQIVVSGFAADMAVAAARLRAAVPTAVLWPVAASVPFHSRMLEPAVPGFRAELRKLNWRAEQAGVVASNITGGWHTATQSALVDAMALHVAACVCWSDNADMLAASVTRIVEIGPASALRPFFRRFRRRVDVVTCVHDAQQAAHAG